MAIPRIFHQVWVGSAPFPDEFQGYQESWRRHHPTWQMRFWTEENLPTDLRRPEVYEMDRVPAERSDIVRLDLLWRYGGVYLDTDFECRKPIDDLLEGVDFFAAELKPGGRINNAVVGATQGHPLLDRALTEVRGQVKGQPFDKTASGPLFLDALIKDQPGVTIMPAGWFYPSTPEQRDVAYAIHHSARSWKDSEGWREAALIAEKRLEKERRAHEKTRKALESLKADQKELKARLKYIPKADAGAEDEGTEPRPVDRLRRSMSFRRDRG